MQPAQMLVGRNLPGGWTVLKFASRAKNATGGMFSTGYVIENEDGRKAFLKAMDYVFAFNQPNTAEVLEAMTNAYLFEKRVCEKCSNHSLRRVVHAFESGSLQANQGQPFSKVEYLIFELADGDIRAHLDAQSQFDVAFALRTLHHVATGLDQLHRAEIAHQDLKPSNVLVFQSGGGSKIGDFGRAWSKEFRAPHDNQPVAGDMTYAPPELLYGDVAADVSKRRYGCDAYHFGSLIVFMFTRVHSNALISKYLAMEHRPFNWSGKYADVLPYVQAAFAQALSDFSQHLPEFLKEDLVGIVAQLCEPDSSKRGHPLNRQGHTNQFGLERYVSMFNLLAHRAELDLIGGAK
jgi:eukaryotic-like serine/threonine-protein kinase